MLNCPGCRRAVDLAAWLDRAVHSVPAQRWVATTCPDCDGSFTLHFAARTVAIGALDGFPGPCYTERARERQAAGMAVAWHKGGLSVTLGGRRWFVPAPPAGTLAQ